MFINSKTRIKSSLFLFVYLIAVEKGLKAQSRVFLAFFSSKLSDSELLDFGVKPIENKPLVKISEFKKINEVFVSKLDNLVKKFPDKSTKIEQAKKDISKILKSLEK